MVRRIVLKGVAHAAAVVAALLSPADGAAQAAHRWDFDGNGDREGWSVPGTARGAVLGGSLWLALSSIEQDPARLAGTYFQILGDRDLSAMDQPVDPQKDYVASPGALGVAASGVQKVRLRILNLSSVTDFFVLWKTREQGWGPQRKGRFEHSRRCTLNADTRMWQEVVCHVDGRWSGTIEQIAIQIPATRMRGDLWIDWIEVGPGAAAPGPARPDLANPEAVPEIHVAGLSQAAFADAFKVLDECVIADVPVHGFTHPVTAPGGAYGEGWWVLDSSLALIGAQWTHRSFAEGVMQGFRDVQAENPDGRIDAHAFVAMRGQVGDVSQLPLIFEVAYDIARRSADTRQRAEIYEMMHRYLDWWLSPVKRDDRTGLVSGVLEETFGEVDQGMRTLPWIAPQTIAPVDLNVAVAVGARLTSKLAGALGKSAEARRYQDVFAELSVAINRYLWDEEDGAYYNYDLKESRARRRLIVTTFDPMKQGIASPRQRDLLLKKLLDPALFNWGKRPLTSVARIDPYYVEATGPHYDGRAWWGNIWTLRNMSVVTALEDAGRPDLAAELNWATVKAFNANYRESLVPSTGAGHGVERYGWSAAHYIGAIVEHLFGVDYDAIESRIRISPHVPRALYGKDIALDGLRLDTQGDTRLSLRIRQSSASAAIVQVDVSGRLPEGEMRIALPGVSKEWRGAIRRSLTARLQ